MTVITTLYWKKCRLQLIRNSGRARPGSTRSSPCSSYAVASIAASLRSVNELKLVAPCQFSGIARAN